VRFEKTEVHEIHEIHCGWTSLPISGLKPECDREILHLSPYVLRAPVVLNVSQNAPSTLVNDGGLDRCPIAYVDRARHNSEQILISNIDMKRRNGKIEDKLCLEPST